MKNKIQKYLSGEREGFSLVELIIVIAIMAILIGIIALAVIPYLEKSRVGKDRQTVDTVYSAFQAAIADCQVTDNVTITIKTDSVTPTGTKGSAVQTAMQKTLDASDLKTIAGKLESKDAVDAGKSTITCTFTASTGEIKAEVAGTSIKSSNKDVPKKEE